MGALVVLGDAILYIQRKQIAELAAKPRLPSASVLREYVEAGGLIVYTADFLDLERRSATFVDRILKGAKPADLPVEQPTKFDRIIDLKTAKALGLTIPQSLLLRADQAIDKTAQHHAGADRRLAMLALGRSAWRSLADLRLAYRNYRTYNVVT